MVYGYGGHIEHVRAGILDLEVILYRALYLKALDARIHTDAVALMQDELRAMTGSLPENALTQQYPTEYVQALRNNQLAAAIDDANLTPDILSLIHI